MLPNLARMQRSVTWKVSQVPPGEIIRGLGWDTYSGKDVNPETALTVTTVYACVRGLAESVSSLPFFLYQRLKGGGKRRAFDHPLYTLLHDAANPEQTSQVFRELMMGHVLLWGNAYAQIIRSGGGQVLELWPLRPDRMTVNRKNGQKQYTYKLEDNTSRTFGFGEILHIPGFGYDGLVGYSPIYAARNAIALAMSAEEFGGKFFANDARPGVVLEHPASLSDPAYNRLLQSWEQEYKGSANSHKTKILEEGMKLHEVGIPPEDAQFLQTRTFQVAEIARIYRYPLAMLEEHDKAATYASVEQFMLNFVIHTLRPWLVRIEQAVNMNLLTPAERGAYFSEFLVDGLLRGDIQSRYQAYATGRQWGWFSANDILSMENMNPIQNGDQYLVPLNMVPAASPARTMQPLLADAAGRAVRREIHDLRDGVKRLAKNPDWHTWLDELYDEQIDFIERAFAPILKAQAELYSQPAPSARRLAEEYAGSTRSAVAAALELDPTAGTLMPLLDRWERELPAALLQMAQNLFLTEAPHA